MTGLKNGLSYRRRVSTPFLFAERSPRPAFYSRIDPLTDIGEKGTFVYLVGSGDGGSISTGHSFAALGLPVHYFSRRVLRLALLYFRKILFLPVHLTQPVFLPAAHRGAYPAALG